VSGYDRCSYSRFHAIFRRDSIVPKLIAKTWTANAAYKVGDRVAIRVNGEVFVLVCIQPGKSALAMPETPPPAVSKIRDWLCEWEIEK
jgi:hypothetical protein